MTGYDSMITAKKDVIFSWDSQATIVAEHKI